MNNNMNQHQEESAADSPILSLLWLLIGTSLLMFSNGNWSIPVAAWLFPVFFLRFFRTQRTVLRLVAGAAAFIGAYIFILWQMLSLNALSPVFRISSGSAMGLFFLLPFLADRSLTRHFRGPMSTLVFPLGWVTTEYLKSLIAGTWGGLAYTQYGNLPLMQCVSITGIWGISFLITWFASVVNFLWENDFTSAKVRKLVLVYGVILGLVLFYGGTRLSFMPPNSETVKVASLLNGGTSFVSGLFQPQFKDRPANRDQTVGEQGDFLKRSQEAAREGARIVVWQEYGVSVLKDDEASFIKRGSELAKHERIYLVMVFVLLPPGFPTQPWVNKLVWLDPDGNIVGKYIKSKPAPSLEPIEPGDGVVPVLTTPFGKIASVICADQDYPNLVSQAGRAGAGLLLVPSLDWKAVSPLHTQMGIFRAIENGCALVKATGEGLSVAVDCQGRILSTLDFWNTNDKVMFSHVPTKNITTIYGLIGDSFAWMCILGYVALITGIMWRR